MEKAAGTTRKSINLGMGELDKAIQALYDNFPAACHSDDPGSCTIQVYQSKLYKSIIWNKII